MPFIYSVLERTLKRVCITVYKLTEQFLVYLQFITQWGVLILEQTACGVSGSNLASQSINLHGDWICKRRLLSQSSRPLHTAHSCSIISEFLCKNVSCVGVIGPFCLKAVDSSQQTTNISLSEWISAENETHIYHVLQVEPAHKMFDKPWRSCRTSQLSNFTEA